MSSLKKPPALKIALAALVGFLAGLAATAFLTALNHATHLREANPALLLALPLFGIVVAWAYERFGGRAAAGHQLILEEIHEPRELIPARMAPLVLFGTVLTHLGGGSAGREGTAVQMGGSLAAWVARVFRVSVDTRRELLKAGLGAGFGSAVGAPLAGFIFGLEVVTVGRARRNGALACAIASLTAYLTTRLMQAPHSVYPRLISPGLSVRELLISLVAGLVFGLTARIFLKLVHGIERIQARYIPSTVLRPFVGGLLLLALFAALGNVRYAGLGIPVIQAALEGQAAPLDPAAKALATAITLGSGFKGGEFIPLVFIGSTLGSILARLFAVPAPLLASLGFAVVFGAAANVPLACSIMAAELFGIGILPYVLVAAYAAFYVSGPRSAYPGQRGRESKGRIFGRVLAKLKRERR